MKYQSLFSGKNKKNIVNLPPAEFAHSVLSVNLLLSFVYHGDFREVCSDLTNDCKMLSIWIDRLVQTV